MYSTLQYCTTVHYNNVLYVQYSTVHFVLYNNSIVLYSTLL